MIKLMTHDFLLWLFVLSIGLLFFMLGLCALKEKHKRHAGILSMMCAICAFISCALEAFVYKLHITGSSLRMIRKIELVVCGVWLGAFLILHLFGYVRLLTTKSKDDSKAK